MVISSLAARKSMGTCEVCRTFWQKLKPEPSARETSGTGRFLTAIGSQGELGPGAAASVRLLFQGKGQSADKADIIFQPEKFYHSGPLFG